MSPELAPSLRRALAARTRAHLADVAWPPNLRLVVLAPHPDDFDAIAVTLRFFKLRGDEINLGVVMLSPRGVEDSFCCPPTSELKSAIREREQRDSCGAFGLPEDHVTFLRVTEDADGNPIDDEENYGKVKAYLAKLRPDLVLLPHGNDPNAGHRFTFTMLERFVGSHDSPTAALLNRDAKTIAMRVDLRMGFDQQLANWKGGLLRCHTSQQVRNLNVRGCGFDERVLRVNREAASAETPYAEEFEVWFPR